MFSRDLGASGMIAIWGETGIASDASVVERITVFTARNAAPAALILRRGRKEEGRNLNFKIVSPRAGGAVKGIMACVTET